MLKVPYDIWSHYEAVLKAKVKDSSRHDDFRKWFRYFWDFRNKYPLPESHSEQVRLFIEKLRQKNRPPEQQRQAAYAVSLFFESQPKNKQVSPSHSQTRRVLVTGTAAPHHASNVSQSMTTSSRRDTRAFFLTTCSKRSIPLPQRILSGNGCSLKSRLRRSQAGRSFDGIISMKRMFRMPYTRRSVEQSSPNGSRRTLSATVMPHISCRPITISGRSRLCSATAT